jgi:hypothetical protein
MDSGITGAIVEYALWCVAGLLASFGVIYFAVKFAVKQALSEIIVKVIVESKEQK